MFGNVNFDKRNVSIVVVIGWFFQLSKDYRIITIAVVNPEITISVQKTLDNLLVLEIQDKPWIVDVSKNSFKFSILECSPNVTEVDCFSLAYTNLLITTNSVMG